MVLTSTRTSIRMSSSRLVFKVVGALYNAGPAPCNRRLVRSRCKDFAVEILNSVHWLTSNDGGPYGAAKDPRHEGGRVGGQAAGGYAGGAREQHRGSQRHLPAACARDLAGRALRPRLRRADGRAAPARPAHQHAAPVGGGERQPDA